MATKTIQELMAEVPEFAKKMKANPQIQELIDLMKTVKGNRYIWMIYVSEHSIMKSKIAVGQNYGKILVSDFEIIMGIDKTTLTPIDLQALESHHKSYEKAMTSTTPKTDDVYYGIAETNGIMKVHKETGNIYISGICEYKKELVSLKEYPVRNSSDLTIAKNKMAKDYGFRRSKYRSYIVDPEGKLFYTSGMKSTIVFRSDEHIILEVLNKLMKRVLNEEEYMAVLEAVADVKSTKGTLEESDISEIVESISTKYSAEPNFNLKEEQLKRLISEIQKRVEEESEDLDESGS